MFGKMMKKIALIITTKPIYLSFIILSFVLLSVYFLNCNIKYEGLICFNSIDFQGNKIKETLIN